MMAATAVTGELVVLMSKKQCIQNVVHPAAYWVILSTMCMFFLLHSPGGLVEPVVEDDAYVDVVDFDRGDHGSVLFDNSNVVGGVFNEVVDVSWMEDINITV